MSDATLAEIEHELKAVHGRGYKVIADELLTEVHRLRRVLASASRAEGTAPGGLSAERLVEMREQHDGHRDMGYVCEECELLAEVERLQGLLTAAQPYIDGAAAADLTATEEIALLRAEMEGVRAERDALKAELDALKSGAAPAAREAEAR